MLGGFFSGVCGFISGAVSTLSNGLSLIVDSLTGFAKTIGDGIKEICENIGTENMLLIGCIALALIIPGFGLPEIMALIQLIGNVAQILHIGGEDSPEEIGMKAEIADKKPEDFESTEAYLKYLNKEVHLESGAVDKLSTEDKAKYGLIGSALDIKAIQEKYHIDFSPEFFRDITTLKMTGEEVGAYIKEFSEKGINKMQDMTNYLRGEEIETEKADISSSIKETMKSLYPEMSDDQIELKLIDMEDALRK